MKPFAILQMRKKGGPLDTQTVTTGNGGGSPPDRLRGYYNGAGIGTIADATSNIYGGAIIQRLYWDENGGTPADFTQLAISGTLSNSGWTSIDINGTTLLRSDASFTQAGGLTIWQWSNTGNHFAASGAVIPVVFN